jgi:microcystin-dependent protein
MSDQYIGEIRMVGFNFAPVDWALCQGQTLAISQYAALFALLGTTFGGNGTSTFQLPDLQGRVPLGFGNGAGLEPFVLGQKSGVASLSILTQNLPTHTHLISPPVSNSNGTQSSPVGAYPAVDVTTARGETPITYTNAATSSAGQTSAAFQSGVAGGNIPITIQPPYLAINFIIALVGIFPTRS